VEAPFWDSIEPYLSKEYFVKSKVSWWKRFWSNPYKWGLWHWIGGRPWTYILRDVWAKCEFVWIVGLVSLGVWLGHQFDWKTIMVGWLIFSAGFLFGHLFWGKEYIPNQKGD